LASRDVNTLFSLYEIYDRNRDSILWFLEGFSAKSSKERCHFIRVCGFFELSGTLVKRQMIDADLYFDVFNPSPFWQRAKSIIEGMRETRPFIYENFELLDQLKVKWAKKRRK